MSTKLRRAAAATLVALAACGCASDRGELARVGDASITLADYERNARDNFSQYPGPPETAKRMLLDDLVRRELLVALARRQGADTTSEARAFRADVERKVLANALFAQLAPRTIPVGDSEAARLHEWQAVEAKTELIYTADRAGIRAAGAALDRGEEFAQVADRYNLPGILPPGGAVGYLAPGMMLPAIDEAVRTQTIGVIGGPFETPQGWFLVRILERRPREQAPLAQEQASLVQTLRDRKRRQVLSEALAGLRSAYDVRVEQGAAQALFMLFQEDRVAQIEGRAPRPIGDHSRVLARYDGHGNGSGTFTLGDAIGDLVTSGGDQPNATQMPAIEAWIESHTLQRVVLVEARRRHIDEEPDVVRQIRRRFDDWLLDGVYSAAVAEIPPATMDDARALFERNPAAYTQLRSASIVEATFADSAQAAAFIGKGRSGGSLREAAEALSPAPAVAERDVTFPTEDPDWLSLRTAIMGIDIEQWAGPIRGGSGWRVIQLVRRDQGPPSWDELPPTLQQSFASAAAEGARDAKLSALTDSLQRVLQPKLHLDRLAKTPWPPPAIIDVGS